MAALFSVLESIACFYPLYFLCLIISLIYFLKKCFSDFLALSAGLHKQFYWLLFYFLAALFLRIQYSHHIDFDFYGWAYIKDALAVRDLAAFDFDSQYKLYHALHIPGYPCLLAPVLTLFKSLAAVSVFNGTLSLLTLGILYFLTYLITRHSLAALSAAGLYAFSPLHIALSAEEIPISASVFFISLTFLLIVLWLRSKNRNSGWAAVLAFLLAINIKFENLVFLPLVIIGLRDMFKQGKFIITIKYVAVVTASSVLFLAPFVVNMVIDQYWIFKNAVVSGASFSLAAFIRHFYYFFIHMFKALPLSIALLYLLVRIAKRKIEYEYILFGWIFCGTILFFWYADIFSYWNMAIILMPLYIICSFMLGLLFDNLFKDNAFKPLLAGVIVLLIGWSLSDDMPHAGISWIDIQREFKIDSPEACVIAPDARLTFPLWFLFPDKHWLFLDDTLLKNKISRCGNSIYYFNPVPYGLLEEFDPQKVFLLEGSLHQDYALDKISSINLYKLSRPEHKGGFN